MSENIVACIKNRATKASGILTRNETYSVSLKLGNLEDSNSGLREGIKMQRRESSSSNWEDVNEGEDLLRINGELRVIVEDNTSLKYVDGHWPDRGEFYSSNSRVLSPILNFSIPLRLEVRRYCNNRQEQIRGDEVKALINIIDPVEDIEHVSGVVDISKSGRDFINVFNQNIRTQSQQDNCSQDLSPFILENKCRESSGLIKPGNMKNLIRVSAGNSTFTYEDNKVSIDSGWSNGMVLLSDEEVDEYLFLNIEFHPPFILGDNYKLRISLRSPSNRSLRLRDDKYETPRITIWRRVKVNLIIQGSRNLYDRIDWNAAKKAYEDAYIELDYPSRDSDRVHVIPINQWIRYLHGWIYCWWRRKEWDEVIVKQRSRVEQDLERYSFPQKYTLSNGRRIDLAPKKDINPTDRTLLTNLTRGIIKRYILSHTNAEECFYILIYRPPSDDPSMAGRYVQRVFNRGAVFMTIREQRAPIDNAYLLVHELGHGLFLKHGIVKFIENYESSIGDDVLECIAIEAGGVGPYWELHDSEGTASCIMSYPIRLMRSSIHTDNGYFSPSIDRYFCGVCLLLLRFYDEGRLRRSNVFRRIQYTLRNGGGIKIAYTPLNTVKPISIKFPEKLPLLYVLSNPILDSSTLNMNLGDECIIFALYPMEKIITREGGRVGVFKDLSTSFFRLNAPANGKWGQNANIHGIWKIVDSSSIDPNNAVEVAGENKVIELSEYELEDDVKVAKIKAVREGSNKIYFGIQGIDDQRQTQYIWSSSLTVNVSLPKPDMVFTEEEVYGGINE